MTRLTEKNIGDQLSPDTRVERESVAAANEALHRIKGYSGATRKAIHSSLLYPRRFTLRAPESRLARQLKREAKRQRKDVPKALRTGFEKDTGYNRAVRLAVSEESLAKDRNEKTYLPADRFFIRGMKGRDGAGKDVEIDVEIDNTVSPWKDRLLTEDEVAELIKDEGEGVRLIGEKLHHIDKDQALTVAKKYLSQVAAYQSLGKVFASNGTSELNIQTAIMFARQNPDDVVAALSSNKEVAKKELDRAKAKMQTFQSINDLSTLPNVEMDLSLAEAEAEESNIASDLAAASFPKAMKSKAANKLKSAGYKNSHLTKVENLLEREQIRLNDEIAKFKRIGAALVRIYKNAKAAGDVSSELNKYVGDPDILKKGAFTANLDPKVLADTLIREFDFKSKEEMAKDVADKEKALKDIESGSLMPTGPEAIMRTYQMHFEKNGMAPTEAKRAAAHLYGRNAIGRKEWQVAKQTISDQDVMGNEQRIYQWPGQQLKEITQGSQESFICHIAESPAIGLQHSTTNRFYALNLLDDTRRAGLLWRKGNARPAWGAMSYGQLLTSYYAIRSALKAGDLNNTSYVRGTMEEITRLLLDKFSEEIAEDMHMSVESDEEKKDMQTVPQQEYLREHIVEMLAGEVLPTYVASTNAALSYSRQETGKWRKAVGRAIARVTGFGTTYGVKKPVSIAGKVITAPFRWMKAGAQKVWEKGNQKSKFYS